MKKTYFLFCTILLLSGCVLDQDFIVDDANNKPYPWTQLKSNVSEGQFQFAIVSDRNGGMRRGIFEQAVDKLNILQPEFVISIGDLIDGYTESRKLIKDQWQEFDTIVTKFQMPFFYVPGNHDISNPVMADYWTEHLGRDYYYFLYRDVLFLCLNTIDGGFMGIGDAQVEYFNNI